MTITFTLEPRHIRAIEHIIQGQAGMTVELYVQQHMTAWLKDLLDVYRDNRNAELIALLMAASNETQRQVRELLGQSN